MPDLWSWNNWLDQSGAAITGASVAGFPVINLLDPRVGRIWRATTAGGSVSIVFAQPHPVTVIAGFGGDMRPGDTFTLRLGVGPIGYDYLNLVNYLMPIDPFSRHWVFRLADYSPLGVETKEGITRAQITLPAGRTDLGRLWIGGPDWIPRTGHIYGSEWSVIDYGRRQVVPYSGAIIAQRAAKRRVFRPSYDGIYWDEGENEIRNLDMIAGTTEQILFVPDDSIYPREKFGMLCYVDEISPIIAAGWERGERQYSLVESG